MLEKNELMTFPEFSWNDAASPNDSMISFNLGISTNFKATMTGIVVGQAWAESHISVLTNVQRYARCAILIALSWSLPWTFCGPSFLPQLVRRCFGFSSSRFLSGQ